MAVTILKRPGREELRPKAKRKPDALRKGSNEKKATIEEIERALRETYGFVSKASMLLGISMQALTERVGKSQYLQDVLKEVREERLDTAEVALMRKVERGDFASIRFLLVCQAKGRGYVEQAPPPPAADPEGTAKAIHDALKQMQAANSGTSAPEKPSADS